MVSNNTIKSILHDLSEVRKNLETLSDDLWLNIKHNDQNELRRGFEIKEEFNRLFTAFDKDGQSIVELILRMSEKDYKKVPVVQKNQDGEKPIEKNYSNVGFYLRGKYFSHKEGQRKSSINLLANLLNELNKEDQTFLKRYAASDYNHGSSRTYVSQDKARVTVNCEDGRIMDPKSLDDGFWLMNNLNNIQKLGLVKNIARFVGVKYGKEGIYVEFKKKKN